MTRGLAPQEQRLVEAARSRLVAQGVPRAEIERALGAVRAELVLARPPREDDPTRVDPRVVARAAAAVARAGLRGHDVTPVRLGSASPSEIVRELRRRLGRGRAVARSADEA